MQKAVISLEMVRDAFLAPHMPQPKFGSKWLRGPTTGPVLEIGFGPPTAVFGSIWSSQNTQNQNTRI